MKKVLFLVFYFIILFEVNIRADSGQAQSSFALNSSFHINTVWPSGYEVAVTLTNNTANPTSSWIATFTLPEGQSISNLWNGVYTANGQLITIQNPQWTEGGIIPSKSSTTFGMIINNPKSQAPNLINLLATANDVSVSHLPSTPVLNSISLSPNAQNSFTVSWNAIENATSYLLEQDTTSYFGNPTIIIQGNVTAHLLNNQPNGTYYYRVLAKNDAGVSSYSNIQKIVINVQSTKLNPPILQPINNPNGINQYQISWDMVQNAKGYLLQESSNSDFSNPQTIFNGSQSFYQVLGRAIGYYFYRVIAYSGSITSQPSDIQGVVVTQEAPSHFSYFVEGYWESWNSTDSISSIVNMQVDIINIAFANFKSKGNHIYEIAGLDCDQITLTEFIKAVHQAGKKVKISIGGATYPLAPQLKTSQDAIGMAQAIAEFVQKNYLDGVDFDIEDYPVPGLQVALIQNTRQLLGNSAIISYTPKTPAASSYPYKQVIQSVHPYVNYHNLMAYDAGTDYCYQQDIQNLKDLGVPASKIVIGLMPGYDDMHVLTSLSDIAQAANYIKHNELGGIMFWDLNRDYENQTGLGSAASTNTAWNILH